MTTTQQLVSEAGGIDNLAMFSAISQFDGTVIDQLAIVLDPQLTTEVVVVRAYRRSVSSGGNSYSNWSWNDTNGGNDVNQDGESQEEWTLVSETNTYANRAEYYCYLHNSGSIGQRTHFFAAASRVMKLYSSLDVFSDSPSGIPGDMPSSVFLRYNRSLSEFLRNVINPEIAHAIATNSAPYNSMTIRQRDVALIEREQTLVQAYLDALEQNNPAEYEIFIERANQSFFAVENLGGFLGWAGVTTEAKRAIDLASDRAGGSLNFRSKADRIKIGLAFVDGVIEDKMAGRQEC
jgi:hypothetical protein